MEGGVGAEAEVEALGMGIRGGDEMERLTGR